MRLSEEGIRVQRIDEWASVCDGSEGSVVVHRKDGFADLGVVSDAAAEAVRVEAEQFGFRVVQAATLG